MKRTIKNEDILKNKDNIEMKMTSEIEKTIV